MSVGSALVAPPSPHLAWRTETIDASQVFDVASLALAPGDRAVELHQYATSFAIATRTATAWDLDLFPMAGVGASLALTPAGEPRVAFADRAAGRVSYATPAGAGWTTETVDVVPGATLRSILALGPGDAPSLLYTYDPPEGNGRGLRFAYRDAGGWHAFDVERSAFPLSSFALAVDASGRQHIAYADLEPNPAAGTLRYGVFSSGAWTWETPDESGGPHVSLALDSAGRPHLAYEDAGQVLTYRWKGASGWTALTVDAGAPTGLYTSIALGPDDRPHLSYWQVLNSANPDDPTRGHLRYASPLVSGGWTVETVDVDGLTGDGGTRIAVDSQGFPHVAYLLLSDQVPPPADQVGPLRRTFDARFAEPSAATAAWLASDAGGSVP